MLVEAQFLFDLWQDFKIAPNIEYADKYLDYN